MRTYEHNARLGVVVNHYNPKGIARLWSQTLFCAIRARDSCSAKLAVEVLVSDGSGFEDENLKALLAMNGIGYLSSSEALGFAQGYNQGLRHLAERRNAPELLATCANDIFCDRETLPLLAGALLTDPTVGCAIPYLTHADYLTQNDWVYKYYREASSMTLNLNVFRTKDLMVLGYVPEAFSGYYNDIAMMIELKKRGLKVVLLNGGQVTHLGMATTATESSARADADRETFRSLYPTEALPGTWAIKEEKLAAGKFNKLWFYLQSRGPAPLRRFMVEISRVSLQFSRAWQNLRQPRS